MPAIPVTPAAGKSWRITEKAPPPQPSKRASFFKGTLEQARLEGLLTKDCQHRLDSVLQKEERSGDARSMQLAVDHTRKSRAGTGILS